MIVKKKNLYNIGKIKPCILKAAGVMLGKEYRKKVAKISFSDSTIKTHIYELAKYIECQVLKKIRILLLFQFNMMKQMIFF